MTNLNIIRDSLSATIKRRVRIAWPDGDGPEVAWRSPRRVVLIVIEYTWAEGSWQASPWSTETFAARIKKDGSLYNESNSVWTQDGWILDLIEECRPTTTIALEEVGS